MQILNEEIEEYLSGITEVDDPVYREMEEYGKSIDFPIVGHVCRKAADAAGEVDKRKTYI